MKTAEVIDESLILCELCTMLAEQKWGHNGPEGTTKTTMHLNKSLYLMVRMIFITAIIYDPTLRDCPVKLSINNCRIRLVLFQA